MCVTACKCPFVHICMRMYIFVCVCVKILEARLSSQQNVSVLDGNKGENQSLSQSVLTEFLIM